MKERYWIRVDRRMASNQKELEDFLRESLEDWGLYEIIEVQELGAHWRVNVLKRNL